jgi:hypothetical protein
MKEIIFFENDVNLREAAKNSAHHISPNIIYIGGNWDLGCLSDTFDGPERREMWRTYFDEITYNKCKSIRERKIKVHYEK